MHGAGTLSFFRQFQTLPYRPFLSRPFLSAVFGFSTEDFKNIK